MALTEEQKRRIAARKARNQKSFLRESPIVGLTEGGTMNPAAPFEKPVAPQVNLGYLEDFDYNASNPTVASPDRPDYGSLPAENRYPKDQQIQKSITNRYGSPGYEIKLPGGTMLYSGKNYGNFKGGGGGGGMYPHGRTTPRGGGARRMKAGEVLMAPAEQQTKGGAGSLDQLITREQAKEMGLGVNQWRTLNQEILRNQGNLQEQMAANVGARDVANIRTTGDLQELLAKRDDPLVQAQLASMFSELELAPTRKQLIELQRDYYKQEFGSDKKKKKGESEKTTEELLMDARTLRGLPR